MTKPTRQASRPSGCNTGSGSGLEPWHEGRRAGQPRAGLCKFIQLGTKCLEQGFICQQLYTIICGFEARVIGMLWVLPQLLASAWKPHGKREGSAWGSARNPRREYNLRSRQWTNLTQVSRTWGRCCPPALLASPGEWERVLARLYATRAKIASRAWIYAFN